MAVKAKYKGDGAEYYSGIPARDLSDEEYADLDVEQKRLVRTSGLYDVKSDAPKASDAPKSGVSKDGE